MGQSSLRLCFSLWEVGIVGHCLGTVGRVERDNVHKVFRADGTFWEMWRWQLWCVSGTIYGGNVFLKNLFIWLLWVLVAACQGSNLGSLHWAHGVLVTGLPGKSWETRIFNCTYCPHIHNHFTQILPTHTLLKPHVCRPTPPQQNTAIPRGCKARP